MNETHIVVKNLFTGKLSIKEVDTDSLTDVIMFWGDYDQCLKYINSQSK